MRRWLVAVGGVSLAVATGGVVGVVGGGSWSTVLSSIAGAFSVVAGAWVAYGARGERTDALPSVEASAASDAPGDRLNVALGSLVGRGLVELSPRGIRDALRRAAASVVAARDGIPVSRATDLVDDGEWTDDDVAARYLETNWSLPADSIRDQVARSVGAGRERPLVRAARRGANAVAARAGIERERDAPERDWFPPGARAGARSTTVSTPTITGGESTGVTGGDSTGDAGGESTAGAGGDSTATGTNRPQDSTDDARSAPDEEPSHDAVVRRSRARTRRFRWVAAYALVALGLGALLGSGAVAFASVPAVTYVAWTRTTTVPSVSLAVTREIEDERPDPDDRVRIRTTVENTGDARLPECRVVDGVPAALSVVDGSPRAHCALDAGDAITFEYVVAARRGVHAFEGSLAVVHDAAGAIEERHVVTERDEITCVPPLASSTPPVPLREQATAYAGNVDVDEGGSGLAFYQTRAYRHGDPLSRIDWHRLARTGELATTEFRQERAASIVVVVDARAAGYVAPHSSGPHALDRSVDAAGTLVASLLADGNRVGIGAISTSECWLAPGAGAGHRERVRRLLATNPALSPVPADRNLRVTQSVDVLRSRIPNGTQVVFLTPLCDDRATTIARRFEAGGRAVTVLSPDPTRTDSPSRRLARVGRRLRVTGLRQSGVRVVDWGWEEPLAIALSRAHARGVVR